MPKIPAGSAASLSVGDVLVVETPVGQVALFNVEGEFLAIGNKCTHQDADLSDGFLEGCMVECPLHASMFDLRTGRPSGPPATQDVSTYATDVSDGVIYIEVGAPD